MKVLRSLRLHLKPFTVNLRRVIFEQFALEDVVTVTRRITALLLDRRFEIYYKV